MRYFLPLAVTTFFVIFFILLFGLHAPTLVDCFYCATIIILLYTLSKKNVWFIVNAAFLLFILYVAGALKLQYFGEAATPADLVSLVALYSLQSEAVKLYGVTFVVLLSVLLLANLEYTKRLLAVFSAMMVAIFSGVLLGANIDASTMYMKGLSKSESVSIRQYYAAVRFYDEWLRIPSHDEVVAAHDTEGYDRFYNLTLDGVVKRDVYVILIESLWDPSVLGEAFVHESLNSGFEKLWKESGQSYLIGPSFGGGTANPEFEILCGVSLDSGFVVFEHPLLHEDLECLPNILNKYGYHAVASHPNNPDFWNRDFAYPAVGFNKYYSISDFEIDEVVGNNYLSDSSLYRQALSRSKKGDGPKFNYILTLSEHYPYMLDSGGEKNVGGDPALLLKSYVGLIQRATRDVYDYIAAIRENDKDALIVVLGDHPPLFGSDYAIYRDAGLVVSDKSNMSIRELRYIYSTPVLVIDGVNGPVNPMIKSMYEIPFMITRMLACYDTACDAGNEADTVHYRSVPGRGVLYYVRGGWGLCEESDVSPECVKPLAWLAASKIVRSDFIFGGKAAVMAQH
jgi:hypothetical protein